MLTSVNLGTRLLHPSTSEVVPSSPWDCWEVSMDASPSAFTFVRRTLEGHINNSTSSAFSNSSWFISTLSTVAWREFVPLGVLDSDENVESCDERADRFCLRKRWNPFLDFVLLGSSTPQRSSVVKSALVCCTIKMYTWAEPYELASYLTFRGAIRCARCFGPLIHLCSWVVHSLGRRGQGYRVQTNCNRWLQIIQLPFSGPPLARGRLRLVSYPDPIRHSCGWITLPLR